MNIQEYIAAELAAGRTTDNIAAEFTKALNAAEEEVKRDKAMSDYLDKCFDTIASDMDTNNIDYRTVAAMAGIAYHNSHNNSKVEDLQGVVEKVYDYCGGLDQPIGETKKVTVNGKRYSADTPFEKIIADFLWDNGVR